MWGSCCWQARTWDLGDMVLAVAQDTLQSWRLAVVMSKTPLALLLLRVSFLHAAAPTLIRQVSSSQPNKESSETGYPNRSIHISQTASMRQSSCVARVTVHLEQGCKRDVRRHAAAPTLQRVLVL